MCADQEQRGEYCATNITKLFKWAGNAIIHSEKHYESGVGDMWE